MTREEAKAEINKVFEPAFANYIITALTEGATPSECKAGKWIDRTEDGYVECPVCGHATTCEYNDEIKDLHYCFWCGTRMEVDE